MFRPVKLFSSAAAAILLAIPVCAAQANNPADLNKVVRQAFEAADDGFDMAKTQNFYSGWVGEALFEPLLSYDYLARPARLLPLTAEAMPEVSEAGKVFVFKIKPGIYFAPDPAFKGKKRELTASDYVYTFKRVLDPVNRSPHASFLEGKIIGLDDVAGAAKKTGKFDYEAPVAGLRAIDKYTLRIELRQTDYNFLYVVAYGGFGAVAKEVIDMYGDQTGLHPVGTGPYMIEKYMPRSKIILTANPEYRGYTWDFKSTGSARDEEIVKQMKGKKMPQVGKVEISIIEEEQSRWLAFQDMQLDIDKLPQSAATAALNGTELKPEMKDQGIRMDRVIDAGITFTIFNMRDPVVGGYSKEKIALRRAVGMAYSHADEIEQMRLGQAIRSEMIIPKDIVGYDPQYRSSLAYDIKLANKLLDHFGYKRGLDGYRNNPDGSPLVLKKTIEPAGIYKVQAEIYKRGLDKIGVRIDFPVSNFADNLKAASACKLSMWSGAWNADFPDGENFLQLLYGPKSGSGNHACYESPAYDALFRKAVSLPSGPERNQIYQQMNRQVEADTPWIVHTSRIRSWLYRPWITGYKKHPILHSDWAFIDVEKH
ncbi:ABC transporter substrate-binding protein [Undibacterium sp. TS12]|uniref:ABC transporter substrate-binding protein n=1 Tax=Undibacterium sp. TS12 TaxID=2908202 RepID=UPI001F4C7A90|nr:ABC transporter substrate-binding protein [Undibacterium sp. TS12]MCH8622078.1 ABC transporter substrate-binding protein [Undibacterium sp. TS12]